MIDRLILLKDLQALLRVLEADLLERSDSGEVPEVEAALEREYAKAADAARTGQNYEDWRSDAITQSAAAWVLACVFARFLEDNELVNPPRLSGPGARLARARDEHELYFRAHPTETDREYLVATFRQLAGLPGGEVFRLIVDDAGDLLRWLSGDAAGELVKFFQRIDADSGALVHDFTDPAWDTRFLGDLYQDLSEAARKKYALLQTPEFVEQFILDRTLEPALDEFGLESFRMIDPACGSGHFLLGAFRRILDRWQRRAPGANVRSLAQRALGSVFGVDVNPYAVAIARFRLLLAALRACGIARLTDAPAFRINLACGDSLLHGLPGGEQLSLGFQDIDHVYQAEDLGALRRILKHGHYHAVVANPPYITPKDRALNRAYRERYSTCHRQYSLSVPFMQRLFGLAVRGDLAPSRQGAKDAAAGYVGQITANSFMKREFGKKLIEGYLPTVDLTHVIDTSGAYIPGHGTPTVILVGRNRPPLGDSIRTVMGIRGEPATPGDPARGLVWSAIVDQVDRPGSQSEFVSAGDSRREVFGRHPWSIGGGGAAELKEQLDHSGEGTLQDFCQEIGFGAVTREDDAYLLGTRACHRHRIADRNIRPLVAGEEVRDWGYHDLTGAIWPYRPDSFAAERTEPVCQLLWSYRAQLSDRVAYGMTQLERGLEWFEYSMFFDKRFRTPLSIAYGEVATHNHFVLDRGGKVFNRTAPVIKLPPEASEDDHLGLLGLLNSAIGCFWMKQVCFPKGGDHVGQEGARVRRTLWDERYAFNASNISQFPLPPDRPLALARQLDATAALLSAVSPAALLRGSSAEHSREALARRQSEWEALRGVMIALQEELDWECYRLYGLLGDDLTQRPKSAKGGGEQENEENLCAFPPLREAFPIALGHRAFEIVLARKIARGEVQSTWFERHGSTPITELPGDWPPAYRKLVERRIEAIESLPNIALIEQPEYKRRWNTEPWHSQLERAMREWLLARLESYFDFDGRMSTAERPAPLGDIRLVSLARLADVAGRDDEFLRIGELYRGDPAFDVLKLVGELVRGESVPLLPVLRYKPSGLRKRLEWEKTWQLQREEDRLAALGKPPPEAIPVPPKYTSADFISSGGARYWALRGKLDVPKERWVSFPYCDSDDGTPMIAWAGYDHLQLARAVSAYYVDIQERLGGRDDERLVPLLACLVELLPWLKQWHNEVSPEFGMAMGDYFEGFIQEEARQAGKTIPELKTWRPEKRKAESGKRKKESGRERADVHESI